MVVQIGSVAHGGSCVARHEGRAVFVRHALPGETVRIRVTEGGEDDRFWRADAIEIIEASADRVVAPCPYAAPGGCGGCDWQHAAPAAQRRMKAAVVTEQLSRLAGLDREIEVEAVPGDAEGLDWRTRVTYAVDSEGRPGLRRHRSHDIVTIEQCLIAHPEVRAIGVEHHRWPGAASVEAIASGSGERLVVITGAEEGPAPDARKLPDLPADVIMAGSGSTWHTETAAGRTWQVTGSGFWQIHPGAPDTLVQAVLDGLRPVAGERAFDLYCGVGLFAGVLADHVGPSGSVVAVEGSRQAAADARWNLRWRDGVRVIEGRVDRVLQRRELSGRVDIVVLDPPRTGAKAPVVRSIVDRAPRAVAYVACDPAALARDVATFGELGYQLDTVRAFDLFPMTHHVECVAILRPG